MAAPVLKFKRGAFADLPTLAVGEPGFTTDRYQLFVGSPTGNKIIGGGDFWNENSTTEGGGIRLYEGTNNGDDFVELKAPDNVGTSITFTLPGTDGSANHVLQTNGSGVLTFGELNVSAIDIDGATDIGAAIADDDLFIVDDGGGGTNRKTAASRLKTYVLGGSSGATFTDITVGSAVTINSSGVFAPTGVGTFSEVSVGGTTFGTVNGNVDDLITLSGVSAGSTTLGTFTGSTISDNKNVKEALQELETQVDSIGGGGAQAASVSVGATDTDATFFPTFVADNNTTPTQEVFKTDAGLAYNPSSNLLTVSGNASIGGIATVFSDSGVIVTGVVTATSFSGNLTGQATGADQVKTIRTNTSAAHYLTFVDGDNSGTAANEELNTSLLATFNPSDGSLVANKLTATSNFFIGGTEVTSTATELNVLDGVTAFLDEDDLSSDSATAIPSQQSVKAYVDGQISGVGVTFLLDADSGTADVFQTGETLTFSGTANEVETAVSDNTITIGLPNAVVVGTSLSAPTVKTGVIQAGDGTASQTIANSTGKVTTSAAHEVQGTFTAAGLADLQGNVDIGNATSDTVTVTGRFDSGLVPSTDNTRDLGSSSLSWKEGHINALEGTQANLSGVATASEFKGTTLTITGGGSFGGNVSITGNLSVGGSVTSIDVEDLRIVSPVVELGLERLGDGTLQPPANETTYNSGVVMYYNHVGINSTNAKIAAMFAKVKKGGDMRIGFATDVEITTVGAGDSVASINHWADIEARGLYITDCAGTSQVISCTGSTRNLENITIDGGAFS